MTPELLSVVVAGVLGVSGTIVGVVMTTWLGRSAERRRLSAEDERRWLADRRSAYAEFLLQGQSMLREIDGIAVFLPYRGDEELSEEDDALMQEGLYEYFARWEEQLQASLGDLQLVAGSEVADLADRVSGALMEITATVETRRAFVDYYPGWFRAQDLLGVLRNAMRSELGLKDSISTVYPRDEDWPWLPDRPTEEEHIRRQTEIPGRPPLTPSEMARLALHHNDDEAHAGSE